MTYEPKVITNSQGRILSALADIDIILNALTAMEKLDIINVRDTLEIVGF